MRREFAALLAATACCAWAARAEGAARDTAPPTPASQGLTPEALIRRCEEFRESVFPLILEGVGEIRALDNLLYVAVLQAGTATIEAVFPEEGLDVFEAARQALYPRRVFCELTSCTPCVVRALGTRQIREVDFRGSKRINRYRYRW